MLLKIFKISLIVIVSIVFIIIISFQVKAELYMHKQDNTYGILKNKQRKCFLPFVWFYFINKEKDKTITGKQSLEFYFKDAGIRGVVVCSYIYDAYMYHVYSGSWHLSDSTNLDVCK